MPPLQGQWLEALKPEFKKEYYKELFQKVGQEYQERKIFPAPDDIFNAFHFTPLDEVKVVILGQEKNIDFTIEVLGENSTTIQNVSDELKREGYKKVEIEKDKVKADNAFVEYASEDYFIAYKIAKKLNISNFIENNNLKNK